MKIYDGSSSICQRDDNSNKMNFAITHSVIYLELTPIFYH